MKIGFFLLVFLLAKESTGQLNKFIDPRDGQVYETIIIGNQQWFRQHLRYKTELSYCPNFNKMIGACKEGNYYLNVELDSICPPGWRVPTVDDWNNYIQVLIARQNIQLDSSRSRFFPPPNNISNVTFKNFNIIYDSLLKLIPIGWVEGNKQQNERSLTLWIYDKENNDQKFHVHLGALGFVKHTHEHHIVDKPKKIRKFAVRCVCDVQY